MPVVQYILEPILCLFFIKAVVMKDHPWLRGTLGMVVLSKHPWAPRMSVQRAVLSSEVIPASFAMA